MKNKIIALLLLVVMVTTAFASCSKPFNYAEEDYSEYVTLLDGFLGSLQDIKIEDGSFTTDEATRQKKVKESIYSSLATYAQNKRDKLTEGKLDLNDTVYYAYYATYEKDGVTYAYDVDEYMKETASPKNSVKLSAIDVEDAKANKLSVAIKNAIAAYGTTGEGEEAAFSPVDIQGYKTSASATVAVTKESFKSVFVSFTRYEKDKADTTKEVANCVKINLHAEDGIEKQIADVLLNTNNTVKIGSFVEVKVSDTEKTKNFDVTEGDKTYTYTNFKILFAVEDEGNEITFDYKTTAELKLTSAKMDNIHGENAAEVVIPKDTTVKYHIFPVYFYNVSDIDAKSILLEALANKITATSLDVFSDEAYKNGDKTVKTLVEELVQVYADNTDTKIKDLKSKYDAAEKVVTTTKTAYDAAEKAVTDAGEGATDAQKTARDNAKKSYEDAVKARDDAKTAWETARDAAEKKIDEILKATKENDEKGFAATVVEQYEKDVYHNLKEAYDSEIVEKVGKEIWAMIQKNVILKESNKYPEGLLEEAIAHLENQYEYEFHTGTNSSTGLTYYEEYEDNGGFDAFLEAQIAKDGALEKQAKELVLPIIQIYVVAKALAPEADAKMPGQIEANKFLYDEENYDGADYSEYDEALFFANHFYFDDAALKDYKDLIGKKAVEQNLNYYGESNVRAAIQITNILDYLLMANRVETGEDDHKHYEYKYTEDGKYLDFFNIKYSIKSETTSESN